MPKNIAFCFDGTWNRIDGLHRTNVARMAQSIAHYDNNKTVQITYYDQGVGTKKTDRFSGGLFGSGLDTNIMEAYHFLVMNYDPGDQLYLFGFSRGAYTARSFAGLLRNCGIMSRRNLRDIHEAVMRYYDRKKDSAPKAEAMRKFRHEHCPDLCVQGDREWRHATYPETKQRNMTDLTVRYLGIWDTVGALGIPKSLRFRQRKYEFHDTALSSFVERARHAVAADERRRTFEPSLWKNLENLNSRKPGEPKEYEQMIFPGVHSSVGGGGPKTGLSDAAFEWIYKGAREQGLIFDTDPEAPIYQIKPDPRGPLFNAHNKTRWTLADRKTGPILRDRSFRNIDRYDIHPHLIRRYHEDSFDLPEQMAYRPKSLKHMWDELDEMSASDDLSDQREKLEKKGLWDERAEREPDRVTEYEIKPMESLESIAKAQMGRKKDYVILYLHNQKRRRLFSPDEIYAGTKIEIPHYDNKGSE